MHDKYGRAISEALSIHVQVVGSGSLAGARGKIHQRCVAGLAGYLALVVASTAVAAPSGAGDASQIAARGNGHGAPACATCHGPKGAGSAAFPRLAGTGQAYLQAQLDAFATGARKSAIMQPIAQQLSASERADLAAFYSKLPAPQFPLSTAAPSPREVGAWLANRGRWTENLPACVQCHGPGGSGVGQQFPPLAGLPSAYITAQLEAWRSGARPPGPLALMPMIAAKLSGADSQAIADYYAGQGAAVATAGNVPTTSASGVQP